jgi:quercetin dioxygenase-like cupin family protein
MNKETFEKSIAYSVLDSIAYSAGSIVSKQISKTTGGNITLFAFDKGQGLSEHTAPFDALVMVLDNEAHVAVNKVPTVLRSGEMMVLPANVPHALNAEKPFKMMLVMLRECRAE